MAFKFFESVIPKFPFNFEYLLIPLQSFLLCQHFLLVFLVFPRFVLESSPLFLLFLGLVFAMFIDQIEDTMY